MSTSNEDLYRSLGRIEGDVAAAALERGEIRTTLKDQDKKLDRIVSYIERQKGARRFGAMIAAGCGTAAGFVVTWWTSKHG